MAKRGPPLTVINWKKVDSLCKKQNTGEEIASKIDVDYDTLQTACKREKGMKFSEYFLLKRKAGNVSLRKRQWMLAMEGNPTMLIWLGKQYLGQADKIEEKSTQVHLQTEFDFSTLDDEQRGMMRNLLKSNDKDGA